MSRSRRAWWRSIAEAREWLTLGLCYVDAPFEVIVAALKDLERQFAREARTDAERLHLQRLTALDAVEDVERRVRRRRKDRPSRQQMLDSIEHARGVAARCLH